MMTSLRGLVAAGLVAGAAMAASPSLAQDTGTAPVPAPSQETPPPAAEAPAPAPDSEFTITGAASIVSQYRFRGLSQSNNRPVVQATFTVADKSGFYLATWGSSASNGNVCALSSTPPFSGVCNPINIGGTEIDVYGGYTHALGKTGLTFDGGGYGYIYPGAVAGNYYEVYASLTYTYGPVTAKAGGNFAPKQRVFHYNFTSPTQHNLYVYGELGAGIGKLPLSIHTHLGHTGGGFDWGKQYFDYVAGVTYKYKSLAFDISVVGTNLSRGDIRKGFGCSTATGVDIESTVVFYGGGFASPGACVNSFYRMSKPVAVGSITASF